MPLGTFGNENSVQASGRESGRLNRNFTEGLHRADANPADEAAKRRAGYQLVQKS
jgi:hypothetical protein